MSEAIILCNTPEHVRTVYGAGRRETLAERVDLFPEVLTGEDLDARISELASVRFIFSTWGMPPLSEDQIRRVFPSLEAVFYAAGSVRGFAEAFLNCGVTVVSGWAANAIPVAEFTVAQILLANKGFYANSRDCASVETRGNPYRGPGNFGETVSLLGAGMIGRGVVERLKPFELRILVWDPFLAAGDARQLGVEQAGSLDEAFGRGFVVSNHLANVPETVGLLKRSHFENMRPHATFINTGRGATVVEKDLADVLRTRPDLYALLDVTDPEPPDITSPFYELKNVILSGHIAGSMNDEVVRMADFVIEEFGRLRAGEPLRYTVTRSMLATMA